MEKLSIGIGPKITTVTRGGTEYILAALSLGGYVKMAGEASAGERTGRPMSSRQRPRGSGSGSCWPAPLPIWYSPSYSCLLIPLIYVLGTVCNFPAAVGQVSPSSAASKTGFTSGDVITSIGGPPVRSWPEAIYQLEASGCVYIVVTYNDLVRIIMRK